MPRVLKYFILGMSKTLDIGNNTNIYHINSRGNIKKSWKNVGTVLQDNISKGIADERRKCNNQDRARIC